MSRKSKRRRVKPKSKTARVVEEQTTVELDFVDDRPDKSRTPDERAVQPIGETEPEIEPETEPEIQSEVAPTPVLAGPESDEALETASSETPASETSAPAVGTLGELLITAREARGVSLEEASARTRISGPMLRNLENDRFSEFPAETYVRGFLRNYGTFLGLDVGMLLRRYEALAGRRVEPAPDVWEEVVVASAPGAPKKVVLRFTLLAVLALGLGLGAREVLGWAMSRSRAPKSAGLEAIERELDGIRAVEPGPGESANPPSSDSNQPTAPVEPDAVPSTAPEPIASPPVEKTRPEPVARAPEPIPPKLQARALDPAPRRTPDQPEVTDLVEEPPPELVLSARAVGPCLVRLQVDFDPGVTVLHQFKREGETRSWTARSGFRVLVDRPDQLVLRLNGNHVRPKDGTLVTFDHTTLEAAVRARRSRSTNSP